MKADKSREIKIGSLIVLGFIIIFGAFFIIGDQEGLFAEKSELYARFADVEGLTVGAPVRVGGMKVGSVNKIGFSPEALDKCIVVTMSIASSSFSKIRGDSYARLGSKGLLGDRTVDITIGSPEDDQLRRGEFITTIEATQLDDLITESGDVLTDVKITAKNAREISWKINYGDGSLAKIINDPRLYTNLDSLLVLWTDITERIKVGDGSFAQFINDPVLYDALTKLMNESSDFMENINSGGGSLGRLATQTDLYDHTDSLLISLSSALRKIDSGEGTLGQFVNNAELFEKLYSTLSALDSLIVDVRQNPKKYVKLSLF